MNNGRAFLAAVATVLASVAMLVALLAQHASVLSDAPSFSSHAVRVAHSRAVESLIVDAVTTRVVDAVGGQTRLEPLIRDAVGQAASSRQVTDAIRGAAQSLQSQLGSDRANVLTLTLPGIGAAVASTLASSSPQLADAISRVGAITVLDVHLPHAAAVAIHDLTVLGRDASLLIVLSFALVALALTLAPDRRATLIGLGMGATVSGLLAAAIYLLGRGLVVNQFSGSATRAAVGAAWNVYLGGLESSGLVLAGIGAAVAVTARLSRRKPSQRQPRLADARQLYEPAYDPVTSWRRR